jgi:hypothetical protein
MSAVAVRKNICTPFSTVPLYRLGNDLLESFAMFIGEGCHVCRKESMREIENEVY